MKPTNDPVSRTIRDQLVTSIDDKLHRSGGLSTPTTSPGNWLRFQLGQYRTLDLAADLDDMPSPLPIRASLREPVEEVARRIRDLLGVSIEDQRKWSGEYDALNNWRRAIQNLGILVFQARGVEVDEMRGFSVAEEPMPVIVLNTKDAPNGRVFTLVHEFCHLLLRKGGICDLRDRRSHRPEDSTIEVFCNAVAAATLVPRRELIWSPLVRDHPGGIDWQESELRTLAGAFSVSWEVVLRRLLDTGQISRNAYRDRREAMLAGYRATRRAPTGFVTQGAGRFSRAATSPTTDAALSPPSQRAQRPHKLSRGQRADTRIQPIAPRPRVDHIEAVEA